MMPTHLSMSLNLRMKYYLLSNMENKKIKCHSLMNELI
jgi:hypothetical protein